MTDNEVKRAYAAMKVATFHRRMKLRAIEYKGGKCQRCGYSKCPNALVFHHRDPTEKDFSISSRTAGWDSLRPELDKCDLLCANCHLEEHERLSAIGRDELYQKIRAYIPHRQPGLLVHKTCATCGKEIWRPAAQMRTEFVYCSLRCSSNSQIRTAWPSKEDLQELVWNNPVIQVAASLGVSNTAVRKRCQKLGIPVRGRGYWQKLEKNYDPISSNGKTTDSGSVNQGSTPWIGTGIEAG